MSFMEILVIVFLLCFSCQVKSDRNKYIEVQKNVLFEGDTVSQKVFDKTKLLLNLKDSGGKFGSDSIRFWMFEGVPDSVIIVSIGTLNNQPLLSLYSIHLLFDKDYSVTGLSYTVRSHFLISNNELVKAKLDSMRSFQAGSYKNLEGYDMCPGGGGLIVEYLFGGNYSAFHYQCFNHNYMNYSNLILLNNNYHYFRKLAERSRNFF